MAFISDNIETAKQVSICKDNKKAPNNKKNRVYKKHLKNHYLKINVYLCIVK